MQLDYGSILAAGQQLVPNLRAQAIEDTRLAAEMRGKEQQRQLLAFELEQARKSAENEQQYVLDAAEVFRAPTAQGIRELQARYPRYSGLIDKVWGTYDDNQRQAGTTMLGSILTNIRNGNLDRALELAREDYEADVAAGRDTAEGRYVVEILKGRDPDEVAQLGGLLTMQLAASAGPDKVAAAYQDLSEEFRQQDMHPARVAKAVSDSQVAAAEAAVADKYYTARASNEESRADIAETDARWRDRSNASTVAGREARTVRTQALAQAEPAAKPKRGTKSSKPLKERPVYVQYARNAKGERMGFNRKTRKWEKVK